MYITNQHSIMSYTFCLLGMCIELSITILYKLINKHYSKTIIIVEI